MINKNPNQKLVKVLPLIYLCFAMFTFVSSSPTFAERPFFRLSIETIAYPSGSLLANEGDERVLKSIEEMKRAGYSEDVEKLFLAYKNRDLAWHKAQTILNKIHDGQINEDNILEYTSPDSKPMFKSKQKLMKNVIDEIKSYGSKARLSMQEDKGIFPDRMFVKKEYSEENISIRVIDFLYHDANHKDKRPDISYITLVLTSAPPYQNWYLSDMYIKPFRVHPPSN